MIDAVSTLSVQSTALRGNPQNGSSFVSAAGAGGVDVYANMPKLGTRLYVRIDSAAERAILEVRASETGEVVNQYPSEAQIKAFQRAEKLATTRADQEASRAVNEATRNTEPVQQQAQQTRDIQTTESVQVQQTASSTSGVIAPSPQPVKADVSASAGGGDSGSTPSSVVV
ncbi:MAG TPA: hypothetical protein VHP34_07715 [Alphaproteobacteria bacterium]|jgi:hypothetical protein|nr:hypothetical protein [Alphaproteobacteria bacterium]